MKLLVGCITIAAAVPRTDGGPAGLSPERSIGERRRRAAVGGPRAGHARPGQWPSYSAQFLERFALAQRSRLERIEQWVAARLQLLRSLSAPGSPRDQTFPIHRTHADPRCLDLSLDPNDRAVGSVWGQGAAARGR
jgi:hypothetical protein